VKVFATRQDARTYAVGVPGRRLFAASAIIAAGLVLGPAVAVTGTNGMLQVLMLGGVAAAFAGAAAIYLFDVEPIALVRAAFIASFFFKGDLTLLKIDEIEDPSGFNLSLTFIAAIALIAYDHLWDARERPGLPRVMMLLFAALFVCAAASVAVGGMTSLGASSLWSFGSSLVIAYAVVSHFGNRDRIGGLIVGVALGMLFTGATALSQYVFEFPTDLPDFGTGTEEELLGTQAQLFSRVPAFMRTPNEMAWVVSTLLPLALALIVCRVRELSPVFRTVLVAATGAGSLAVLLSLARGSWIALLAGFGLIAAFGWLRLSADERRSYLLTVAGAFVLVSALVAPFADRIYDRLTEDDQGAAAIRVPLMQNAVRTIGDNPVTGVGLNAYRANMARYDETDVFVSQIFPQPVHNVFAHVTAEVGIPGGIVFALLFIAALAEGVAAMISGDRLLFALGLGTSVALVAFAISGMKEPGSLGSVRPPMRTLFLLLGIVMAMASLRKEVRA
jgi:hypothetical protein